MFADPAVCQIFPDSVFCCPEIVELRKGVLVGLVGDHRSRRPVDVNQGAHDAFDFTVFHLLGIGS